MQKKYCINQIRHFNKYKLLHKAQSGFANDKNTTDAGTEIIAKKN